MNIVKICRLDERFLRQATTNHGYSMMQMEF